MFMVYIQFFIRFYLCQFLGVGHLSFYLILLKGFFISANWVYI
ncbi:hypothetical protein PROPEN_02293 [Proteus penneri ATCC 35198]|nr:hypothetical protein PROPEN_02293 [Proteus penneri ATCC 35198]